MKGKLITIEGIDGSGKGTQAEKLVIELQKKGIEAKSYTFPAYDKTFFGNEVGAFLRGDFGCIDTVHPKLASILFACDRLEQKAALLDDLDRGVYVVCDRYVESNIAHQAAKLPEKDRAEFTSWVKKLEYQVNQLPKPDITFFLDVPLSVSKELVLKKKQRSYTNDQEDIHEAAHGYLENVYNVYKELESLDLWTSIKCTKDNTIKPIDEINRELMSLLV